MRIGLGLASALGAIIACGGRGSSRDRGPDAMAPEDAGTDPSASYLPSLRRPPGARIVRASFEPSTSQCDTSDDCAAAGSGARCATLTGSYRVCVAEAQIATAPSANPLADECDSTRPCAAGACYAALQFPSGQCGLGGASLQNQCLADTCRNDDECGDGICGPPGLMSNDSVDGGGIRQCFSAACLDNDSCTLAAGGVCAFVASSCGSPIEGRAFRPAQLACVYPGGCLRDSDCGAGWCSIVDGTAVCLAERS